MRHPLHLEAQFARGLLQLLLFEGEQDSNARVGLVDGQHLVARVPALEEGLDGDALVEAIHADHAAASLQVLFLIECSHGPDQFVGQGDGEESEICASRAFNLQLVLQSLLPFLSTQQLLQAEHAQLVPAVQGELVPRKLLAFRTLPLIPFHFKNIIHPKHKQPDLFASFPARPKTEILPSMPSPC